MPARGKISAWGDEAVDKGALCLVSLYRVPFSGLLAKFGDQTECFVELSQS
jgi:hypothetical protein